MSLIASFMNLAGPDLIIIQAVKEFQKAKDEFSDELHKAGKSETETAKSDVKPAQSTVPRVENQPASSGETRPDPNQVVTPGDKADQV